jgi:hypothetical protein
MVMLGAIWDCRDCSFYVNYVSEWINGDPSIAKNIYLSFLSSQFFGWILLSNNGDFIIIHAYQKNMKRLAHQESGVYLSTF